MKRTPIECLPTISHPLPVGPQLAAVLEPGAQRYTLGACQILVGHSDLGWHLSISCGSRLPTWDEVAKARYALLPANITVAMLMPPESEYVNLHPYCFHLWEVADRRGEGLPVELLRVQS
jgi:hypothetical protein